MGSHASTKRLPTGKQRHFRKLVTRISDGSSHDLLRHRCRIGTPFAFFSERKVVPNRRDLMLE
jgi:hypothetical protein